MIGQQATPFAANGGTAQSAAAQRPAVTEHYTFNHVIDGRAYQIEFDYTSSNQFDMRAKLGAAIEAWNKANPDKPTTEEKVLSSRWSIGQDVDPHTGVRRSTKAGVEGIEMVFRRVINGEKTLVDFVYPGDPDDHDAKMAAAVAAWNAAYPENQTTSAEVRAGGRWSIYVPVTRESGTPCIF